MTTPRTAVAADAPLANREKRVRAHGAASREKILDAATQIAGERGYEGTSIKLVSELSGLPASSIYWHFADKDHLLAAVIDRSFARYAESLEHAPPPADSSDVHDVVDRWVRSLADFPEFLRLGLMLCLERRPQEPTARTKFVEIREHVTDGLRNGYTRHFSELQPEGVQTLVTLTLALLDGLFVARELGEVDLSEGSDVLALAVGAAASQLTAGNV